MLQVYILHQRAGGGGWGLVDVASRNKNNVTIINWTNRLNTNLISGMKSLIKLWPQGVNTTSHIQT